MADIINDMYIMNDLVQDSGYTEKRIPEDLRSEADYIFIQRDLGASGVQAAVTIGNGDNGIVTVSVDEVGSDGNQYTLTVEDPGTTSASLSATISDTDITLSLATDSGGDLDATANTATLIATELDGLTGVSSQASGDGSGVIGANDLATYSFRGGADKVAELDFARDFQIVKTPNSDLFNHIGDIHKWICDNEMDYVNTDGDFLDDKVKILVVSLNGKWLRNY